MTRAYRALFIVLCLALAWLIWDVGGIALKFGHVPALDCRAGCVHYMSADGEILDLSTAGVTLSPDPIPDSQPHHPRGDFDLAFEIKVSRSTGHWRTVLHRGEEPIRFPLVALHPETTHLHLRVSSLHDVNDGLDSLDPLPLDQWVAVEWKQRRSGKAVLKLRYLQDTVLSPPVLDRLLGRVSSPGAIGDLKLPQTQGVSVRNLHLKEPAVNTP